MPTAQTAEARMLEKKNTSYTKRFRRIAKVANDEKALKAELQRMIEAEIDNDSVLSVERLNSLLTDFAHCAYLGIVYAEHINESKDTILTFESFEKVAPNEKQSEDAARIASDAIDHGLVNAFKKFRDPETYPVYVCEGGPYLFEAKKMMLKDFFELYRNKMHISAPEVISSTVLVATCPGLSIYTPNVIFEKYKAYLLKLAKEEKYKPYESAVNNMIHELDFKGNCHYKVRPESITILANAVALLESSARINNDEDRLNYETALTSYNTSVEAFKQSPGMKSNQRRGRLLACAALAMIVISVVTITLVAMLATPAVMAALPALLLLLPLMGSCFSAIIESLPRRSASSIHPMASRFKHTTLFSKVFEGEAAKPKSPSASLLIA